MQIVSFKRVSIAIAFATASLVLPGVRAEPAYTAKAGRVSFNVASNLFFLKVSGTSTAISGGGQPTVEDDSAVIRNLHFEVDPMTFKTGISLRDQHLYEKVFRASDGSIPKIVLRAETLRAKLNPQTSKWEGNLQAELTLRGVTRPVSFHVSGEKKADRAIVSAEGVVKTSAFGVKPISYSGATVNDEVRVTVSDLLLSPR